MFLLFPRLSEKCPENLRKRLALPVWCYCDPDHKVRVRIPQLVSRPQSYGTYSSQGILGEHYHLICVHWLVCSISIMISQTYRYANLSRDLPFPHQLLGVLRNATHCLTSWPLCTHWMCCIPFSPVLFFACRRPCLRFYDSDDNRSRLENDESAHATCEVSSFQRRETSSLRRKRMKDGATRFSGWKGNVWCRDLWLRASEDTTLPDSFQPHNKHQRVQIKRKMVCGVCVREREWVRVRKREDSRRWWQARRRGNAIGQGVLLGLSWSVIACCRDILNWGTQAFDDLSIRS